MKTLNRLSPQKICTKNLNLLKFNDIYHYFCLKFIHSLLYGRMKHTFDINFSQLLPKHHYETRYYKLNLPKIRLPVYNCDGIIYSFPEYLLENKCNSSLKKKIKSYFFE